MMKIFQRMMEEVHNDPSHLKIMTEILNLTSKADTKKYFIHVYLFYMTTFSSLNNNACIFYLFLQIFLIEKQ